MCIPRVILSLLLCLNFMHIECLPAKDYPSKTPAIHYNPCSLTTAPGIPWPKGIIPYKISTAVPDYLRIAVHEALKKIENNSCVQFLQHTTQHDFVHVEYGERCCSHVGQVGPGQQQLYVSEVCINVNESIVETLNKLVFTHDDCRNNDCGGSKIIVQGSPPGLIVSPGETDYPPLSNCVWKLWKPKNKLLALKFTQFHLEHHDNCLFDFVHIFEEDGAGKIIRQVKICSNLEDYHYNTSANASAVSIHFHSDDSIEHNGFQLQYSLIDDKILCNVENGGCSQLCISNENGIKKQCDCLPGYRLDLDKRSCTDIDECQSNAGICQQRCTNLVGSYYCYCRGGYMLLHDMRTCQACESHFNSSTGLIVSPSYSRYQNCKKYISVWPGHYLNITLQDVVIPVSTKCRESFLKTSKGNFRNARRICGNYTVIQYVLQFTGSQVMFKFQTGNLKVNEVFKCTLKYEQIPIHQLTSNVKNQVNINGSYIDYNTDWI